MSSNSADRQRRGSVLFVQTPVIPDVVVPPKAHDRRKSISLQPKVESVKVEPAKVEPAKVEQASVEPVCKKGLKSLTSEVEKTKDDFEKSKVSMIQDFEKANASMTHEITQLKEQITSLTKIVNDLIEN